MMKLTVLLSALLAMMLLAGPSFAAEKLYGGSPAEMTTRANIATRNQLIGLDVVNQADESIGVIRDVNVNSKTGEINYVILDENVKGGGTPAEKYAVPLAALKILPGQATAQLTVSEDKLETTPAKEVGMTDEEYKARIEEHYGVGPAWHEGTGEHGKMMMNNGMMKKEEGNTTKSGY